MDKKILSAPHLFALSKAKKIAWIEIVQGTALFSMGGMCDDA